MLNTVSGASCATGSVAGFVPPKTDAAVLPLDDRLDKLHKLDADLHRVREAIVRCWNRTEAAKRRCDFRAELGAKDDMERLSLQLADLHLARAVLEVRS